jgi:hypothetical protein
MSWQELPPHLQSAARKLGTVPLFSTFDQYVGAALWRTPPAKAEDIWSELVDWQLAHAPRPGCYQLHSQVHAFFEAKASSSLEHVLTWNWIWRYRLQEAWPDWRYWRLSVPPSPASFWEHVRWSGQLPGTASNFKFGSLVQALIKRYWATDWSLKISPLTWVVVKRLSVIMYSGSLLGLAFIASQLWWPSAPVLLHLVFFIVGFGLGLWGFWRGEDRMRIFDWELQGSSFEEILTDTNAYTVST